MDGLTRRRFLTASAAAIAASAAGGLLQSGQAQAAPLKYEPEKGATLRVLRWKRFVQGDEDQLLANTRRFTELTGVEVRIDSENWEDLRPKAAVAADVGAGPDIIISTDEQPQLYPDKLVDVSELANYLGQKYGGWFEICPEYCTHEGRWIAIPTGVNGAAMVKRTNINMSCRRHAFSANRSIAERCVEHGRQCQEHDQHAAHVDGQTDAIPSALRDRVEEVLARLRDVDARLALVSEHAQRCRAQRE